MTTQYIFLEIAKILRRDISSPVHNSMDEKNHRFVIFLPISEKKKYFKRGPDQLGLDFSHLFFSKEVPVGAYSGTVEHCGVESCHNTYTLVFSSSAVSHSAIVMQHNRRNMLRVFSSAGI